MIVYDKMPIKFIVWRLREKVLHFEGPSYVQADNTIQAFLKTPQKIPLLQLQWVCRRDAYTLNGYDHPKNKVWLKQNHERD